MGNSGGRSAAEVEKIVIDFERSGLNRREYCEQRGIALPTLDWYRRRVRANRSSPNIVPVRMKKTLAPEIADADHGFTLVLGNGCRIEIGWDFNDDTLTRLIRIAGAA
jgi:hypothetical protein